MNEKAEKRAGDIERFFALRENAGSLIMATIGENGLPLASYAPFVFDSGAFYVYLSRLSEHTVQLIEKPIVSILLIEDEAAACQIFARKRLTYACESRTIGRDDKSYDSKLTLFTKRYGNVVDLLRSLPDFVLFSFVPTSGRFVTGFGNAYELTGDRLEDLKHLDSEEIKPGRSDADQGC